jgi:hypothetical protein
VRKRCARRASMIVVQRAATAASICRTAVAALDTSAEHLTSM